MGSFFFFFFLLSFQSISILVLHQVFSLWAVSSKTFGLGFSTNKVGVVLTISGGGLLVFQTFLYPLIERILGPVMVSRVAAVLSVPVLQSYPFIAMLSGFSFLILLNCASMLMNVLTIVIATGLSVLQNNAVDQKQRGAANGIAMTGMSLFRGLGLAIGGFLVSWTQKRQDTSFLLVVETHPGLRKQFWDPEQWPKHVLIRYTWQEQSEIDVAAGFYVLFGSGLVLSFILVIYILQSSRDKLARFVRETIAESILPGGGVAKGE